MIAESTILVPCPDGSDCQTNNDVEFDSPFTGATHDIELESDSPARRVLRCIHVRPAIPVDEFVQLNAHLLDQDEVAELRAGGSIELVAEEIRTHVCGACGSDRVGED